ncbi:ATP-binding cassette, subfamily B [Anaerovirgula multivorans]|uniref:ATP-binding cassette, subfamily B n=1 Tax=Anaerovirgula multivorans TaxID=312168 RepID=A0A239AX79_9FIRM|nr:ABC transporter ATP-binding protein [Anaerovirgula multivorans]SNR99588.1 ATP-binding cassette, subfamily B [Anaerovirgula multivorans]
MKTKNNNKAGVRYLLGLANSKKLILAVAIGFSVLSGLCTFVPFLMIFRTILLLFGEGGAGSAMQNGIIAIVAIVLRFVFQAISAAMTHVNAYNILYHVRRELCRHLGKVNLGFFTGNSTGEIKKIMMEDVERLEMFFAHQIPDIVVAIVVPVAVLVYLFTINVWMSLILLLPIVLTTLTQVIMLVTSKNPMDEFYWLAGKQSAVILQYINGMPVMKTYNLTADSYREYADTISSYNNAWWRAAKILSPPSAIITVIIESGLFFVLPLGGYLYLTGSLALSSYIFFAIMSIVFLSSYINLANFAQIFSQISSGIVRIKEIMDIPAMGNGNKTLLPTESHSLTYENVSFAYDQQEVLHNFSLDLPIDSLTAFVGPSGAGKSTAAQLVPRFWDVSKGAIRIDGIDIRELEADNLMDNMSFVFQEAFMLNDTLYENIAMGKHGCTRQEVEVAAKSAQIHDFIMSLPKGYDTVIGSEGVKLSGGERQRVCIARAILKDAPILIFDEATSFTDIENERKIQLALESLLESKTTVMIAHRLHTIVGADQICVFQSGNLMECGTHHDLVASGGAYASMWQTYCEAMREVAS